jgi:signal peptidase I
MLARDHGNPGRQIPLRDPMLSPSMEDGEQTLGQLAAQIRSGDRVLVLKTLYPFATPKRFDVVVFKNPVDPIGDTQNYIKRLVGLPDEMLLLLDGDVFTGSPDAPGASALHIQRKPEYIQRAVWQKVFDQDYQPIDLARFEAAARRKWPGIPWSTPGWNTEDPRAWRWSSASMAGLEWESSRRGINDWAPYNMLREVQAGGPFAPPIPVSDIRVAAAVQADDWSRFRTELRMISRGNEFSWTIAEGRATVAMTRVGEEAPSRRESAPIAIASTPGGRAHEIEFWQVDQSMSIFVDGERVAHLDYDWSAQERLAMAFNGLSVEDYARNPMSRQPTPPKVDWSFEGTPLTLRRVRLDRDIYYRPGVLNPADQAASNGPPIRGLAFATDPTSPAVLGSNQFLMCGDNSAASRDGRVWGRPHPIVKAQIGEETPFVVPRNLLLGKACAVYFPSPVPMYIGGRNLVPDFGRLRFIR